MDAERAATIAADADPCGTRPTPTIPSMGPYAVPTPVQCDWRNHECNPYCPMEDYWEGGEMWKKIPTTGYKNIIVEFDMEVDLNGDLPHSVKLKGEQYKSITDTTGGGLGAEFAPHGNDLYRPYSLCKGVDWDEHTHCPDARMIEEMLLVMYTIEYSEPYKDDIDPLAGKVHKDPIFDDDQSGDPKGISKWRVAKVITREILREDYQDKGWITVRLDFSPYEIVDGIDGFGIWFRCQLDDPNDKIRIDNIKVFGQTIPMSEGS